MSLLNTLDAVRAARGLPALPDPGRIEGFGPGNQPAPSHLPPAIEVQNPEDPMPGDDEFGIHDEPVHDAPPLPAALVPTRRRPLPEEPQGGMHESAAGPLAQQLVMARALERAVAELPQAKLALVDKLGEWKGRKVVLNDEEYRQVLAVIFAAQRRELDADSAEVLGAEPRRRRRRTVKVEPEKPVPVVAPAPRRRGRARGSLLNRG